MSKLVRWVLVFALIVVVVAQGHPASNRAEIDARPTGDTEPALSVLSGVWKRPLRIALLGRHMNYIENTGIIGRIPCLRFQTVLALLYQVATLLNFLLQHFLTLVL